MTGVSESDPRGAAAREALENAQLGALRTLLGSLESNPFYAPVLARAGLDRHLPSLATFLERMPFTEKSQLVEDQARNPPYGSNLTYPIEHYVRLHQTSGSSGSPLSWLDTAESWEWLQGCWLRVFEAAGIGPHDRVLFPFSFGPFLGFWIAFDAARRMGCLTLPGGGLGSAGRLRLLAEHRATAVLATPTYALRLAEVAAEQGLDLPACGVRALFVAGEPGGSIPATRRRLEQLWGARVYDHHGMTEVGPVSFPNPELPGILHVFEASYLAEILEPENGTPVARGEIGELVLTTLGRTGSPLLRYRTGDLVRRSQRSVEELGCFELALEGGILARADDMVIVRGVNLYPSAIEEVMRSQEGLSEYRVLLSTGEAEVVVEPQSSVGAEALAQRLETSLRAAFSVRIPVRLAAPGELPRYELKAKRWIRQADG